MKRIIIDIILITICISLFSCNDFVGFDKVKNEGKGLKIFDLRILIDTTHQLTKENIFSKKNRFRRIQKIDIKRNNYNNWLYFQIQNNKKYRVLGYILIDYASIEHIEFYEKYNGKYLKLSSISGWSIPVVKRPFRSYLIAFPILLNANEFKECFFKVNSKYFAVKTNVLAVNQSEILELNTKKSFTDGAVSIAVLIGLLFSILSLVLYKSSRREGWMYLFCMIHSVSFALLKWFPYFFKSEISSIFSYLSEVNVILGSTHYLFFCLYFSNPKNHIEPRFVFFFPKIFQVLTLLTLIVLGLSCWQYELVNVYFTFKLIFAFSIYPFIVFLMIYRFRVNVFARILLISSTPLFIIFVIYMCIQQFGILNVSKSFWSETGRLSIVLDVYVLVFGIFYKQRIERNNLFKENKEKEKKILTTQIETQEAERQRLAQDLHDDLGGTLSAIKGRISNETTNLETLNLVEKAIEDLRLVSRNLLPPELTNEGLAKAIHHTIERLQSASEIKFTYITFGKQVRMVEERELNIYRIVSEILNNILKHSKATSAIIQIVFYDENLHISIEDNGIGIKTDPNTWGIGLKNIHSRAEFSKAKILIDSNEKGTTIILDVPYH